MTMMILTIWKWLELAIDDILSYVTNILSRIGRKFEVYNENRLIQVTNCWIDDV